MSVVDGLPKEKAPEASFARRSPCCIWFFFPVGSSVALGVLILVSTLAVVDNANLLDPGTTKLKAEETAALELTWFDVLAKLLPKLNIP